MTNQAIPVKRDEPDTAAELKSYRVHLNGLQFVSITVEATDPDSAIDSAYIEDVSGICAQCSGWKQHWSREVNEVSDDGLIAYEVVDESGESVWTGPTTTDEAAIRELERVRQWLLESDPICRVATLTRLDERIAKLRNGGLS